MRTYKRKQLEYNIIEGIHELCRLCLEKTEKCVPIFTDDQDNICVSLALRIMICIGLEITRDENLPNKVCNNCCSELEKYYTFKKKCIFTYQKLKSHLLAVQEDTALLEEKLNREKTINNVLNGTDKVNQNLTNSIINSSINSLTTLSDLENSNGNCNIDQGSRPIVDPSSQNLEGQGIVLIYNENQQLIIVNDSKLGDELICNYNAETHTEKPDNSTAVNWNQIGAINSNEKPDELNDFTTENNGIHIQDNVMNPDKEPQTTENTTCTSPTAPTETPTVMGLSSVLSTILLELGILSQNGDDLAVADYRTIHLESGDGNNLVIQLVEEEECQDLPNETLEKELIAVKLKSAVPSTVSEDCINERPMCGWCGKRLSTRSALTRHIRDVHVGARPYKCQVCERSFAQPGVLRRHQLVHDEVRPYQCKLCPKSFTQRGSLRQHARTHAAPSARPLTLHACPHCDKHFLHASGLSRHMVRHRGQEYRCVTCGRCVHDRCSLLRHFARTGHGQPAT